MEDTQAESRDTAVFFAQHFSLFPLNEIISQSNKKKALFAVGRYTSMELKIVKNMILMSPGAFFCAFQNPRAEKAKINPDMLDRIIDAHSPPLCVSLKGNYFP